MQHKLATWSTADKERKFNRLLRIIADRSWLQEAARITLASSGARTPGIDGVDKQAMEADLPDALERIRAELLAGSYQPKPARRVYIPKTDGKQRPLGIPSLRDRIVQRAMLMAMEPIWESDFHRLSYGFRPERSVHHAIRTVKIQLQDSTHEKGRWVVEGDLASYFDTVHHKLLMKCLRKRIRDRRFLNLVWRMIKAGHIDRGLFRAASEGVPQGGVISPLLSNIVLNEFDQWLETRYLSKKARKDRWYWNDSIKRQRPIALRENRQWKPAAAYCRYADDFVVIVKGTKAQAKAVRAECRAFLEDELKLTLNMAKTRVTHVDDGFDFLGHRIIRKRGPRGTMRPVTTIPKGKLRNFAAKLAKELSGNYSENKIDLVEKLNRQLAGWANFYRFTDYTAIMYGKVDRIVFWKLAHWLARKHRMSIKSLMRRWIRRPADGTATTWVLFGRSGNGNLCGIALRRLVTSRKDQFRWRNPAVNPYLLSEDRKPKTTRKHPQHRVYPYLLRGLAIDRPNQVWAMDLTYIPMARGFVYLVAVLDWYSRKVLSWRVSITMDVHFCLEALEEAIALHGSPEIMNTDQGSQFTSQAFTDLLKEHDIRISMDGKGAWRDNVFIERLWRSVKYEEVYLHAYDTVSDSRAGIGRYFNLYNRRRPHSSLKRKTPDQVYFSQQPLTLAA
jgi:group II intron reverse transcriptase/maturase